MKNSNKITTSILLMLFAISSRAGDGIIFDRPELISFIENGVLTGYYNARYNNQSCTFLFAQIGDEVKGAHTPYSEVKIITFIPGDRDLSFPGRDRFFDIKGELYKRDETWIIRTDEGQAGCENALGAFTYFPADKVGGEVFTVKKRIPAIGVRLVDRKSFFYDMRGEKFIARKSYLTKWDGVIALKTNGQFVYIRSSNTRPGSKNRVTTGWIHSADLVNPFPPAGNQYLISYCRKRESKFDQQFGHCVDRKQISR